MRTQLDRCNKRLLEMKRQLGEPREDGTLQSRQVLDQEYALLSEIQLLALNLMALSGELESYLDDGPELAEREPVLEIYFRLREFLWAYERLDDSYQIYERLLPDGSFLVKLMCVNPAALLRECLERSRSTLFFSATLLPIRYYKELLSGDQEEYAVYAESPFPQENRLVLAAEDVSSRYSRRSQGEYQHIADYICRIVQAHQGNYMIFFPSYRYLGEIETLLRGRLASGRDSFELISQSSHMTEEEKEAFLGSFETERDTSLAALCVLGGIFSEGIDLKEERLIGAVIIGTGLPQVNTEQEILREYFDENGGKGFSYAYQYPGMNKVMQAAGRVIRTATDRGVIALLDDRFLQPEYTALFPMEWGTYTVVNRWNVEQALQGFWSAKAAP